MSSPQKPQEPGDAPLDLTLRILYRDALMLVIDKPARIAVHASPSGGDHLEAYFETLRFGLPHPPALAHRLDRDTSGCLVLGRHRKALAKLGGLFANGRVRKTYWAVVAGAPPDRQGRIDRPLRKVNRTKGWRVVEDASAPPAITDYRMLGQADGMSWLELEPLTGRTHQLRAHCALLGCPILGDDCYGPVPGETGGLVLHLLARSIVLPLYPKREPVVVTAPVPDHMREALVACGFLEAPAEG